MFHSNLDKFRRQLHLGGEYGVQNKVGLRPAELGFFVDGEAVFEVSSDGQEAFRIVQRKKEVLMMSYGDLKCWKENFKEDYYQEWLTRASPSGLDEDAVQHMIARNTKAVTEELAMEKN